jgi:hypothetical protein
VIRSAAIKLLVDSSLNNSAHLTYTEYGCGAKAPFSKLVGEPGRCFRYDLTAWDEDCLTVNLNDHDFSVEKTDVAILGGVVEYLDDPVATLRRLSGFHKYVAFSYYCLNMPFFGNFFSAEVISRRAFKNGWRNHYTEQRLLSSFEGIFYYLNAKRLKRELLFVAAFSH